MAHSRARSASRTNVTDARLSSSSTSVNVTLPSDIPHITCDDVTSAQSVGRLSALPPPHRAGAAMTRNHSLRAADRRCGSMSNVIKRHSTSSVTSSPSSCYDGSRPQPRRSALLVPPTWNPNAASTDVQR